MELTGKKVLMIIASKNFRDEEYIKPKEVLSKAGAQIITASSSKNVSQGVLGAKVKPDILISEVEDAGDYDAIIFVGGAGSQEYWDNSTAHKIAKEAAAQNKVIAAICIAPATLANAGILKGRKVTAFPSVKTQLVFKGANYTGKTVEIDGNIITGSGPESAEDFGKAIAKALAK